MTHVRDATRVVAVTDLDGELCGVYPDVGRAVEYINDWLRELGQAVSGVESQGEAWRIAVGGKPAYVIHPTHYRL